MKRRPLLAGIGALTLAGCLGETDPTDGETDSEEHGENDTEGAELVESELSRSEVGEKLEDATDIEYEEVHVARTHETPPWAVDRENPAGYAALYDSAADATESLPFEEVEADREDDLEAFIDETDFDAARLLYVVAVGLGTSDLTTDVDQLGVRDGELVGSASVGNGDEGDSMNMYASTLVRVTPDGGGLPDRATVLVQSRQDREIVVEATS
ncbi:hypothetical protein GS429_02760 [Natronorubrum sp. JWXQ-INN-674]|uniref:Uncharacterized protein n=1 Tax=Natronorubrum halalkaliphilum TaxID=2691917 RepID=A0A6B0VIV0_9EURY|nr:hypothetical protein [Natronorubrum halalkaliphilum]MXV60995.1 hypothetical protein [Natronorubrum halalkaliphilum]